MLTFNAAMSGMSYDADGRIVRYFWEFGNGKTSEGAKATTNYQLPGRYTIKLTVVDEFGAQTTATTAIDVIDNRADMFVEKITWTPQEPVENDVVTITATIGNKGYGDATLGFLTGFYIDNQYMGYTKIDIDDRGISLGVGEKREITFNYVATAGVHVVKVVANDILDTLKETDKGNNSRSAVLSNTQITFTDVMVNSVTWMPEGDMFDTQSPFVYRTVIKNIGDKEANNFYASLYIDDEYTAKQFIPVLAVGAETTMNFNVMPRIGKHKVEVKLDDLNPVLIELNIENNSLSVVTPEFKVTYPEVSVGDITWKPSETTLAEGTSLSFEAKIVNNSSINITKSFAVNVAMDGKVFNTINIDSLSAGEVKSIFAKWTVIPGDHKFTVVVDAKKAVISPGSMVEKTVALPKLSLLYPNLHISNVNYSPIKIEYNKPVTFIVSVNNQSVATAFKRFNVGLYVDGKAVGGAAIDGIRGYSTVPVAITWTPDNGGARTVRIVVDSFNELNLEPLQEGIRRQWQTTVEVLQALTMESSPNEKEQDEDALAVLYTTDDNFIPLSAKLMHSGNKGFLLSPNEGAQVRYELKRGDILISNGDLGFSSITREFTYNLPITAELTTGTYQLEIIGNAGIDTISSICNIKIMQQGIITIETNKQEYQMGEYVYVSGRFVLADGTPIANEQVVLDFQLNPALREPRLGRDEKGNEILMTWSAELIKFVKTDNNGNFEYSFQPITGEAGDWNIVAFGYKRLFGQGITTNFKVWGMVSTPTSLSLTATKNSQFSKAITLKHASPVNDSGEPLTAVSASLINKTPNSKVSATLDMSSLARTLSPGAQTSVIMNVSAPLDCADTAEYEVIFTSAQGATCTTKIRLNLRPATPIPVTDPKTVQVGINPGDSTLRVITLTNEGRGYLEGIKVTPPQSIPWINVKQLTKTRLYPNESTLFEIEIAPNENIALGQYQDRITVSDATGKFFANVAMVVEVTAAKTGGISFRVTDDIGSIVNGAEITIISKEPYTSSVEGRETTYYPNYATKTDANGTAQFYDKPLGEYNLVVMAQGREKFIGECIIMPSTGAPFMEVKLKNLPVQIEWTVVPTTIEDEYEIKLELTFGAHIPKPEFGFNPPWINVPKNVDESIILEANIVNTGLIAITDVVASVVRENKTDMGISIVGGGYIGEIPAHGSKRVRIQVQPGVYNLLYGNAGSATQRNFIKVEGTYVSFDSDTGLPIDPAPVVTGVLPLYNPSEKDVKLEVRLPNAPQTVLEETLKLPEGQMQEISYIVPDSTGASDLLKEDGKSVYEVIQLTLSQKATLERQAFDATLKITNGYPEYSLQNLRVDVTVTDEDGNDVTNKNFVIPTGLVGISDVEGNSNVGAGQAMTATWQIIPGDSLGGTTPEGKVYYAKALISYYVNGRLVQTSTEAVDITIMPQPKLKLNYYVPHKILSNTPFRLGVTVENSGYGAAKNLAIDSGKLEITSNQAGLLTDFEILTSSFGSTTNNSFKLEFGDIEPAKFDYEKQEWIPTTVSGYWLVRWNMPIENEDAKPYEGEFRDFKATLTHKDYKGVQLNPLITAVATSIIGKDNLLVSEGESDGSMAVVNEGITGFPDYLLNLTTGLKIPLYMPSEIETISAYNGTNMKVRAAKPDAALAYNQAMHQIIMIPQPQGSTNITVVKRTIEGGSVEEIITLTPNNYWIDYGNIYIVDRIPVIYSGNERSFVDSFYEIEFGTGVILKQVEYSRFVYKLTEEDDPRAVTAGILDAGMYIKQEVFYDTGIYPDEGDNDIKVRVLLDNKTKDTEQGTIVFYAKNLKTNEEQLIEEVSFTGLQPYIQKYVYCNSWVPNTGGRYELRAELKDQGREVSAEAIINSLPISNAGVDIVDAVVNKPVTFDGTRSYDKDGYISAFVWDFGDGESGVGPTPTHTYTESGTYKVKLFITDNNLSSVYPPQIVNGEVVPSTVFPENEYAIMQITVLENRPDLFIEDIIFSPANPNEGEMVTATAIIRNGTLSGLEGGLQPVSQQFFAGFYINDKYQGFAVVDPVINVNDTKNVNFTFSATSGAQKITVIANDIGKSIEEADFDNNRFDKVINGTQTDFADISVGNMLVGIGNDAIIDLEQNVTISADIKNIGLVDTGKFRVLVYANDELIASELIGNLTANQTYNLNAVFKPKYSGDYVFKVMADLPISAVVELNEDNNIFSTNISNIGVRYPDLDVGKIETNITTGTLAPGQSMIIFAEVGNIGDAPIPKSTEVTFFVNNRYLGSRKIEQLADGDKVILSMLYNDPNEDTRSIKAIVNANNNLLEKSMENNIGEYRFTQPINVTSAELSIISIETENSQSI
ncbi:MAG: PKD domain-containing protein, partial [Clostridiaceae bacterium]|nr:PKD domain-containing protein [Clostridiaceae bacterium]